MLWQDDVKTWLESLGLQDYWVAFERNTYKEPNDLADLKLLSKAEMKETFGIEKEGHLVKMMNAVKQLKYPTPGRKIFQPAYTL